LSLRDLGLVAPAPPFTVRAILSRRPRWLPGLILNPIIGVTTTTDGDW
jgi:hypothetical protein